MYVCIYSLTPCSTDLLEKLTGFQLVKKFPTFYETRKFITAFTSARHLSLSWASSIQSATSHPTSLKCISILSSHLRLGLPSGLFPSGFPTKTLYTPRTRYLPHPSHSFRLNVCILYIYIYIVDNSEDRMALTALLFTMETKPEHKTDFTIKAFEC
jgi:hypothetical protein